MGVDAALAERLVGAEGAEVLAAAQALSGLDPLQAGERLRRDHDPALAAAALQQLELRSRANAKFGDDTAHVLLTRDGLEQATRAVVAQWRAAELQARGVQRVVDLGCGLGSDALACARQGIGVVAVERDPVTAVFARANLSPYGVEVQVGEAEELAPSLLGEGTAVLADPARRTGRGRTWQVSDFTPSYELVTDLVRTHGGVVKFGPGLPYGLVADDLDATWVSDRHDAVEVSLWGPGGSAERSAVVLPTGDRLVVDAEAEAGVGGLGRWLVEPDPAVIRAEDVDTLAVRIGGRRLARQIAYLACDEPVATPYGTVFEVLESFAWKEKLLRAWVRDHDIGTLEIKKRGIEVDPSQLRRRLKLSGTASATVVITPTPEGARVLVVRRVVTG